MKEIKCPSCIEGKLLPAIPIPGMDSRDRLIDCPDCEGTAKLNVDPNWKIRGERFRDKRLSAKVTLRRFCIDHNLPALYISQVERGLRPPTHEITDAYSKITAEEMTLKKPAKQWCKEKNIVILDPDGWRRDGLDWGTPITEKDFDKRAMESTQRIRPDQF